MWALCHATVAAAAEANPDALSDGEDVRHPAKVGAPYGVANLFALGGFVEAGPALGAAVSADAGISWVLHVHVEVGGSAGRSFLDAAPDGMIGVGRLNLEVAYPISIGRNEMAGLAIAADWRRPYDQECYEYGGCLYPPGSAGIGVAWLRSHRSPESAYFSAFVGNGFQVITGDAVLPLPRIRMEWGRANGRYYGFEITGPLEATAMFGVHL
jgi:hypothetical protein